MKIPITWCSTKPEAGWCSLGRGHQDDALLNGLMASRFGPELRKLGTRRDFGVIHRLDRDTSGALLV